MSDFAINEIKIAKANSDDAYYNACLDAAYEAYKVIENRGHTGASIDTIMIILNRLVRYEPLSLIEDTPDVWCDVAPCTKGNPAYQCKRYSGLFKDITDAGATYPYGIDPNDSNIRIAPSLPPVEELEQAMEVFCICAKLAAVERCLAQ